MITDLEKLMDQQCAEAEMQALADGKTVIHVKPGDPMPARPHTLYIIDLPAPQPTVREYTVQDAENDGL